MPHDRSYDWVEAAYKSVWRWFALSDATWLDPEHCWPLCVRYQFITVDLYFFWESNQPYWQGAQPSDLQGVEKEAGCSCGCIASWNKKEKWKNREKETQERDERGVKDPAALRWDYLSWSSPSTEGRVEIRFLSSWHRRRRRLEGGWSLETWLRLRYGGFDRRATYCCDKSSRLLGSHGYFFKICTKLRVFWKFAAEHPW